jgi:prophage maintenance system killer protein
MAPGKVSPEETLDRLMRRAREPFASAIVEAGFAGAIRIYVRSARHLVEVFPREAGEISMSGVRDPGALWLVGEDAERVRSEAESESSDRIAVRVIARVFGAIAYRHPFYDANKRTAFVATLLLGRFLGLNLRDFSPEAINEDVIDLTAREATDDEVAAWLLSKVFIAGNPEGEVRE